ncbi:3-keto-5-aminohexanoate cleavage protein [Streptomyces sp. H27-H1]|uniref:3-keto-5-aminohexanoate cleavage protein n=1 Tax=Streptomyces sp. H27-H1 TaxID=2996461 RepID=UPI00226FB63A|nr:3-keto-5-aminohexanoate cleavage protein [Streptomyces sp. H27-H1]MCY0925217.1 3-keto-5-aminohexanoate cleavage protein [Streptomyces sp. H27-H1]
MSPTPPWPAQELGPTLVVSLNGSRDAADGAAVPMSPDDLVEAALAAVDAGAREVLVHPRTPCGRESLSPRVVGPLLEALGNAGIGAGARTLPDAAGPGEAGRVAVSVGAGAGAGAGLGAGAEPDHGGWPARVRSWTVLPDRAVVRFAEPGARELAEALLERGVAVDAEVAVGAEARPGGLPGPLARFLAWPVRDPARVRLVAELSCADPGPAAELLRRLPPVPVVLFGREAAAWPVLRLAARYGTGARIGIGDVLHLPDGRAARSNAELVAAAARARGVTTAGNR